MERRDFGTRAPAGRSASLRARFARGWKLHPARVRTRNAVASLLYALGEVIDDWMRHLKTCEACGNSLYHGPVCDAEEEP